MLIELRLENYAVIDSITVEFASGLNLLTGETGAGKSILIDALALLLGEKASVDVIRTGTDRAVIAGVFETSSPRTSEILENNGLDANDGADSSVIIRREIVAGGKGRVFVNNQPATVAVLKQLAPYLATIHAQNESLLSFDANARLGLLDTFAGTQLIATANAFAAWKAIAGKIEVLQREDQDRLRLLDLWTFQKREIDDAKLKSGEDQSLAAEKLVLANAEKIYAAAMRAFDLLYEGESATTATLSAAQKHVEELARYEPKFQDARVALENARISVEDVGATLRDYAGGIQASPEYLAEVEDRLAAISALKRKYGSSVADIIAFGEEVTKKLAEMENKDEVLRRLQIELGEAGEEYLNAARAISKKRYESARKLEKLVESEINDLAMNSKFHIEVSGTDEQENWSASGFDDVRYMISTNPGEPAAPLEQIASGGEMSRVMLALKSSVEAGSSRKGNAKVSAQLRTLIFDEIDIGIGGRAAEAVGKKLKSLSRTNQVLCVTHLPQIATFADHHYLVEKKASGGRTRTSIQEITGVERTEEVARMLSGAKLTETSIVHAEQMIKSNG